MWYNPLPLVSGSSLFASPMVVNLCFGIEFRIRLKSYLVLKGVVGLSLQVHRALKLCASCLGQNANLEFGLDIAKS